MTSELRKKEREAECVERLIRTLADARTVASVREAERRIDRFIAARLRERDEARRLLHEVAVAGVESYTSANHPTPGQNSRLVAQKRRKGVREG